MFKQSMSIKRQKGFTITGWIVVVFIFLFFAYLAMILTPYLVSNHTMNNVLESLKQEPGITQKSDREILGLIDNRLIVNQVKSVKMDDFEIVRPSANVIEIYVEYEDKAKFMNGVFIVFEREKSVELIRN